MSLTCIYCTAELTGTIRPAHAIPKGLGGRLTSTTTVCNDCNNSFSGIEGTSCARLAKQSALIGALRGDRSPISATIEFEGSKYRAALGRMVQLAPPPTDDGHVWSLPATRADQIRVVVEALTSQKLPPEAILDGRFRMRHSEEPSPPAQQADPINLSLTWCDHETKRVMAKSAIELLAIFDGAAARRSELEAARRFARYAEGDPFAGFDSTTEAARLPLSNGAYIHGVDVWTADTTLNYRMILFTYLRFVGTLTDRWHGKPIRCSYSFDIQDPATRSVECADGDGSSLVNKTRRVRDRELAEALDKLSELNISTTARRRTRAPAPSFEDLYPDVEAAMKPRTPRGS